MDPERSWLTTMEDQNTTNFHHIKKKRREESAAISWYWGPPPTLRRQDRGSSPHLWKVFWTLQRPNTSTHNLCRSQNVHLGKKKITSSFAKKEVTFFSLNGHYETHKGHRWTHTTSLGLRRPSGSKGSTAPLTSRGCTSGPPHLRISESTNMEASLYSL